MGRLGNVPSFRLLYVSERLFVDGLSMAAVEMGMFRPAFTSGPQARRAIQSQLFRPAALLGRKTSRRIQAPPASLPLFGPGADAARNLTAGDL